ncbi:MAG: LLM class F420-dependent oxidoreductase [Dehalococcoidia bacterium]
MQFGVHLPHLGRQADRETVWGFAQRAEALGLDSAWASDHIAWPAEVASRYPYSENGDFPAPFGVPWLDPLGTLLFVAGCTERIRLGTTVLILGYRPPVQTAKLLATLDQLSGGRAILGVGVGWMREEFDVLGMPFDHRGARADEQLEVFETLFSQPLPRYTGRYYRFPEIGFEPKPQNGHIPVWVGGHTDGAFRRAARYGDGFHAAFQTAEVVAGEWAQVRALCEQQRRDPGELELSVRVHLGLYAGVSEDTALYGSPEQMLARIDAYAQAGVSHIVLDIVAPGGVAGRLAALEQFMADVAPLIPRSTAAR